MPDEQELDDATLVSHTREGRVAAYAELIARYERVALSVALRYCNNYTNAEDAVQEAFLKAFQNIDQLRDATRFSSWFLRITERESIRLQTTKCELVSIDETSIPTASTTEKLPPGDSLDDDLEQLVQWLGQLPEHEQHMIMLHHLEGLTARQISARTGQPIGTITKQISRAMKRLQGWANQKESTK